MPSPISDEVIGRLISGEDVDDLAFYDVSDCQLYGRKHARRLRGKDAERAVAAGCEPIAYQSVLWWCLVFIPVRPIGVYVIMPRTECDDPDGDAEQYRGIRIPRDTAQITVHYFVTLCLVVIAILAIWWLFNLRDP
jgi:hypothetical protein